LELTNDTLKITKNDNATKIDLKPYKQTLTLDGADLSISDGNTVTLSTVEQDPKVGVLSQNFIPKWDTTNPSLQNSIIYSENAKVGIGITSNLNALLHLETDQSGNILRAYSNGTSGMAGEFGITQQSNTSTALRAFTLGTGYAAYISVNNISSSSPALYVSTTGTGPAGKFSGNTQGAVVDVQNDNANASSIGVKSFCSAIAISGTTNNGRGVEGIAQLDNGVGVYGFSSNYYGGVFETGATDQFALKSAGDFWCTTDVVIDGNTGMGANPSLVYRLYVNGDAFATGLWQTSDETLKTDIETIPSALDKVMQLNGVQYKWIDQKKYGGGKQIGFIAQQLKEVFPGLVKYDGKNYAVQYAPITAVLVEAMKEMKKQNDELREENRKLAAEIENLKLMMNAIQLQLKK
jgi:hypothetical protein